MQIYTAELSEDVNEDTFLNDWSKEPGNDGIGNPSVDFRWSGGSQVTAHIHSNPGKAWAEDNFKQFFAIVLHRSAPNCRITFWM